MTIGALIVSTLVLASMYGLVAIGISITWSSIAMLNLAAGFIFTGAGYTAYVVSQWLVPLNWPTQALAVVTVASGMVGGALFGLLVGAVAFLPLNDRPNFQVRSLIATLAISIIGTQLWMLFFGPESKPLPQIFGLSFHNLGWISFSNGQVGTVVVSVVVLAVVILWMRSSRNGLQMRAMMMNPLGAAVIGVSVRKTGMRVLAIAGALTGMASVLLAQTFFVSPTSGVQPLAVGLIISLAGGLGSIPGTVAAAFLIALIEAVTARYLSPSLVPFGQFLLVIIILIVRPRGLGGLLEDVRE